MSLDILNVTEPVRYSEAITKKTNHYYHPLASTSYGYGDEIRISIPAQDTYLLLNESFLHIQGKLERNATTSGTTKFDRNGLAFLFQEIRLYLNGIEVDATRNVGMATTLKCIPSLTKASFETESIAAGINELFNNQFVGTNGVFNACIPLKHLLGIAEDFKKVLVATKLELVILRSRSDNNALYTTSTEELAKHDKIKLEKIIWQIPHITLSDSARLPFLRILEKDIPLLIPFRTWDYQENPLLPCASNVIWNITTKTQLEKPRYVIVGLQIDLKNQITKQTSSFNSSYVKNMKIFLNNEPFPSMNFDSNFDGDKKKFSLVYKFFTNFQQSYYGIDSREISPCLTPEEFASWGPIFVFDCSNQSENLKNAPVNIRLEIEADSAIIDKTSCSVLIISDRIVQYSPLSGLTKIL